MGVRGAGGEGASVAVVQTRACHGDVQLAAGCAACCRTGPPSPASPIPPLPSSLRTDTKTKVGLPPVMPAHMPSGRPSSSTASQEEVSMWNSALASLGGASMPAGRGEAGREWRRRVKDGGHQAGEHAHTVRRCHAFRQCRALSSAHTTPPPCLQKGGAPTHQAPLSPPGLPGCAAPRRYPAPCPSACPQTGVQGGEGTLPQGLQRGSSMGSGAVEQRREAGHGGAPQHDTQHGRRPRSQPPPPPPQTHCHPHPHPAPPLVLTRSATTAALPPGFRCAPSVWCQDGAGWRAIPMRLRTMYGWLPSSTPSGASSRYDRPGWGRGEGGRVGGRPRGAVLDW